MEAALSRGAAGGAGPHSHAWPRDAAVSRLSAHSRWGKTWHQQPLGLHKGWGQLQAPGHSSCQTQLHLCLAPLEWAGKQGSCDAGSSCCEAAQGGETRPQGLWAKWCSAQISADQAAPGCSKQGLSIPKAETPLLLPMTSFSSYPMGISLLILAPSASSKNWAPSAEGAQLTAKQAPLPQVFLMHHGLQSSSQVCSPLCLEDNDFSAPPSPPKNLQGPS